MNGLLRRLMGRRTGPPLDRTQALCARPWRAAVVRAKDRPDGGLVVTVEVPCAGWQRLLTGAARRERSFGLDRYGRGVLEACDGQQTVKGIVLRFAAAHRVSLAEAEMSVTAFLRILLNKGLIVMETPRPRRGKRT